MHQHPTADTTNTTSSSDLSDIASINKAYGVFFYDWYDGLQTHISRSYITRAETVAALKLDHPTAKIVTHKALKAVVMARISDLLDAKVATGELVDPAITVRNHMNGNRAAVHDLRAAVADDDMLTGEDTSVLIGVLDPAIVAQAYELMLDREDCWQRRRTATVTADERKEIQARLGEIYGELYALDMHYIDAAEALLRAMARAEYAAEAMKGVA